MGDAPNGGTAAPDRVGGRETWIDRNYRWIMLASMLIELLLLGYIAWKA